MDLAAGIRGKRAFVTGASSGLGAHFARVLAGCGAAVAIGARRRERLDDLARELDAAGAETTVAVDLDVADESSVSRALAAAEAAIGPLDVLVNNAGIADGGASLDTAPEAFDRVVATNLRGVWLMSVAAAERWRHAQARRRDRQHRLDPRLARFGRHGRLCGLEGRRRADDEGARARMGALRHPRQRARAGLHRDRHQRRLLRRPSTARRC